jgi:4-amino-4-deoxy-L-arabinose transferase-like glycosyltransferase
VSSRPTTKIHTESFPSSPRSPLPRLTALLLFGLALLPRLPGLNIFLTSDENTNIFLAGSDVIAAFLNGDWRATYWHFYPGVTMSWLDAIGMAGQYMFDLITGAPVPPFTQFIHGDILSIVVANRLPYAILTAAAVSLLYLLARQLLSPRVALLAALFLAFDPFYLAHSRVAHGDAPVAVFMAVSALALFVYISWRQKSDTPPVIPSTIIRHPSFAYLFVSAVAGGLAALTKAPGPFMALFVVGLSVICAGLGLWAGRKSPRAPHLSRILTHWLTVVMLWGLVSLAVFILLWPSMWVDPLGTIRQMWDETFGKVNAGHLVYFFGQPTLDPGPWFYLYVIPFRMTPIVLIGSILSLLWLLPDFNSKLNTQNSKLTPVFLLWLFVLSLLLFGNFSPKKQDRYLLPLFPFLDFLAAVGWVGLIHFIIQFTIPARNHIQNSKLTPALRPPGRASASRTENSKFAILIFSLSLVILLFFHALPTLTYYPYYLTYFNPLLGGPTRAAQTTLMGWGEGMEQVAAYLNTKPNAERLYVASTPSQTLLPYFAGTGENFYTNDIALRADYVVLYLAQVQRLAPSPEIVNYFLAQPPEKEITIKGVTYAKIYPGPKFILADIPPDATPANIGLDNLIRLAGYKISKPQSAHSQLTLYWHALVPPTVDYTVSVRALAADGRLLAQQDSWPVDGLLPTSQWRQGDYVTDAHPLDIAAADLEQVNEFEIVVYNLNTGETLGPPIILTN